MLPQVAGGRRNARAEEAETGFNEDRYAEVCGRQNQIRGYALRSDMTEHYAEVFRANGTSGGYVLHFPYLQGNGAYHPPSKWDARYGDGEDDCPEAWVERGEKQQGEYDIGGMPEGFPGSSWSMRSTLPPA